MSDAKVTIDGIYIEGVLYTPEQISKFSLEQLKMLGSFIEDKYILRHFARLSKNIRFEVYVDNLFDKIGELNDNKF